MTGGGRSFTAPVRSRLTGNVGELSRRRQLSKCCVTRTLHGPLGCISKGIGCIALAFSEKTNLYLPPSP